VTVAITVVQNRRLTAIVVRSILFSQHRRTFGESSFLQGTDRLIDRFNINVRLFKICIIGVSQNQSVSCSSCYRIRKSYAPETSETDMAVDARSIRVIRRIVAFSKKDPSLLQAPCFTLPDSHRLRFGISETASRFYNPQHPSNANTLEMTDQFPWSQYG